MYTVYVYDPDTGEPIELVPATSENYKQLAWTLHNKGFPVKVFEPDMTLVYTLGI